MNDDPPDDATEQTRPASRLLHRADEFQRRHRRAAVPLAVIYKYFDDQGSYLAALITYYAFLSLFPLLLIMSSVLNLVLAGDVELQDKLVNSALGQFPVVGDELSKHTISGSGVGLAIGILGTLYGGLGVAQAAQNAMNVMWRVPRNERPNPFAARARSLLLLAVVGLSVMGTTVLSALGASAGAFGADVGDWLRVALIAAAFVVNSGVFCLGFQVATARHLTWRQVLPGAVAAAVAWQVLQSVGTAYVGHVVKHASDTNGVFALVLGLIAWLYLESVVVVLAVQYNVVRALKLWPRALLTPFTDNVDLTRGDEAAYTLQAQSQRSKGFQVIEVTYLDHDTDTDTRTDEET